MNYTYFYKDRFNLESLQNLETYDYLISFYTPVARVLEPLGKIKYNELILIKKKNDVVPSCFSRAYSIDVSFDEMDLSGFFFEIQKLMEKGLSGKKICVDATGFVVPYLLCMLRVFFEKHVCEFDVIYSEPQKYKGSETTEFTDQFYDVRQVFGMAGTHTSKNTSVSQKDLLIIATGYDHSRIIDVANKKKESKKVLLFGFPSLSPGMFQENIIRAKKAESGLGEDCFKDMDANIYSPANDPFATAQAIKNYLDLNAKNYESIYFAPLSSKPQTLGIALYYICEKGWEKKMSVLYPMCKNYIADCSKGIANIWRYKFDFSWLFS